MVEVIEQETCRQEPENVAAEARSWFRHVIARAPCAFGNDAESLWVMTDPVEAALVTFSAYHRIWDAKAEIEKRAAQQKAMGRMDNWYFWQAVLALAPEA